MYEDAASNNTALGQELIKSWVCLACGDNSQPVQVVSIPSNVRYWKKHFFKVGRCSLCGSLNSMNHVDLAMYYKNYPFCNRTLSDFTRKVFGQNIKRLEKLGLTSDQSVLDYGTEKGILLDFLKECGYTDLSGYDPFSQRFSDIAVMQKTYNAIILMDVLEHVEDPRGLLASLAKNLKPNGLLMISTPRADEINLANFGLALQSLHQPYHRCIFSEKALFQTASSAGFHLERFIPRHSCDTPYPFTNWTFLRDYMAAIDDTLDVGFEPPRFGKILTSPRLLFLGLVGFLFPLRHDMVVIFRKLSI